MGRPSKKVRELRLRRMILLILTGWAMFRQVKRTPLKTLLSAPMQPKTRRLTQLQEKKPRPKKARELQSPQKMSRSSMLQQMKARPKL